jgi:DNA-binding response OmpR family regulator
VIDDEESIRGVARYMLEMMGFEVLSAVDGHQGVDLFRRRAKDIRFVLLDMAMPHLDGEQTYRELRRIRGDVRAILCSGFNEQSATSRFAGKGLAGFLQKPYTFEVLRAAVRQTMES